MGGRAGVALAARCPAHTCMLCCVLACQAGLLSGVQEDLDSTHLRLRGVRKKVASVLRQSRQDRQLCLIIGLSCVLVILTMLALL